MPVEEYAHKYPHSLGKWAPDSKTDGGSYSHERSACIKDPCEARIVLLADDGPDARRHCAGRLRSLCHEGARALRRHHRQLYAHRHPGGGRRWNADDKEEDLLASLPDRTTPLSSPRSWSSAR